MILILETNKWNVDLLSSAQALTMDHLSYKPSYFAPTEQDLSRRWCVLHRSSEAMLICQMGCYRDGAVAGAYRGISLYLLNCLVARLILSKTVVSGFRTLFCINRPVLSEVFIRSAASTAQTDRHYAFKGEATVNMVLHFSLENTAANQNILNTQSHWNIMFGMVLSSKIFYISQYQLC